MGVVMISKLITGENNMIINQLTAARFPNRKNPRKISSKWFSEEIMTVLATGQSMMVEKVINNHKDNPYESVDELIGDLQLIAKDVLNQFNMKGGVKRITQYSIEDMLPGGRLIKREGNINYSRDV